MLPRPHRLPTQAFKEVFKKGKRLHTQELQIITLENNMNVSRFGFIVSTKIDKRATVRNRIKRILREKVRNLLPQLQSGKDIIIVARKKDEKFSVSFNSPEVFYSNHDICSSCGKPIKNFLAGKGLIAKNKK